MIIVLLIILLIISGLITAVVITIKKAPNNAQSHITKADDTKITGVSCPVSEDKKILKSCDITDVNSCGDCAGGGIKNSCIEVSDSKPYKFDTNGKQISVPNGNWCLHAIQTPPNNFKCNSFSGYPIAVKKSDREYGWKCQCKYPSLFQNTGEFGDCTTQLACNPGNLVCPPGSNYCTPGKSWLEEPKWDPRKGVCDCPEGMKYIDYSNENLGIINKTCVNDSCVPGKYSNSENTCECPPRVETNGLYNSYINCPKDMPNIEGMNTAYCTDNYPQCLKDPCNPGGYWDPLNKRCACNNSKGYISRQDSSSIVKMSCYRPCADNNFCLNGSCKITNCSDSTKNKAYCYDCVTPYKNSLTKSTDNDEICNGKPVEDCTELRRPDGNQCKDSSDCQSGKCGKNTTFGEGKRKCLPR